MIGMGAPKYSAAINAGGINKISGPCYSKELSLYINGVFVETVYDNAFSSGQIGLSASTEGFPGMLAAFDHIIAQE